MEEGIQQILQDVQHQLAELATRKKEFEEQMKQRKEDFEKWKQNEAEKMKQELEEAAIRKDLELIEREKKISAQEEFIRDQQLKNSKMIKLNVGGKQFMTTLTTLTSDKDSMLAAMFSGRHVLEKDEDGFYFIDRDGELFSLVLHYLRTGRMPEKLDDTRSRELKHEAQYYQLFGLLKELDQLQQPMSSSGSRLRLSGIYTNGSHMYSFIDSKFVTDFRDIQEYTVDYFNTLKIAFRSVKRTAVIVDEARIRIDDELFEYHAPAWPNWGTVYAFLDLKFTLKEAGVIIQRKTEVEEIETVVSTTKDGVPMIIANSVSRLFFVTAITALPVFYCYGEYCVARALDTSDHTFYSRLYKRTN